MKKLFIMLISLVLVLASGAGFAADTVPTDIQQPGTQPSETGNLESPNKCDNCHGGYNSTVEPAHNWRGSMMANAGRDPIFWATVAIAEQDFDGAGDLCIRCHSTSGWLAGRSIPTDGSALAAGDADGVDCDYCHKLTNPDDSEHIGVQIFPFIANDCPDPPLKCADQNNITGYLGSGISSIWAGNSKLGPYSDPVARHKFEQSQFHRSPDFCGTCHDVSNAVVGDLAHNNGTQVTADPVVSSGVPGGPVVDKAAFNNVPYKYGIVERTFSEYKSGRLSQTLVSDYPTLPAELQTGAPKAAYESAIVAGTGGNYADGTPRYFSCQTCHMRPVDGKGCNKKGVPSRKDLPLHDMTGGNYWMPEVIQYLDLQGKLRLGGGLTAGQIAAMNDGATRAKKQLSQAASLEVTGDTLKVVNLTGHKLISGYPEGRRMWLNIKWYGDDMDPQTDPPLREDGAYGAITVNIDGTPTQVNTILYPNDSNTKIYEAHYGMTQEWARQLIDDVGYSAGLVLSFDHISGHPDYTLGDLKNGNVPHGTYHETFHFAINNTVLKDNRIPTYRMSYEEARKRNALPVPDSQYGCDPSCSEYNHYDEITLDPPAGATFANIDLLYQPTSWEYIQFLYLANTGQNAFLANEGVYMLEAWLNNGMAAPYTMASSTWGSPPEPAVMEVIVESLDTWSVDKQGNLASMTDTFRVRDTVGIKAHTVDKDGLALSGSQVFAEIQDSGGGLVKSMQGFSDTNGVAILKWKTGRRQATGIYSVKIMDVINSGYVYGGAGITSVTFTLQ